MTLSFQVPVDGGRKRTVTLWLAPAPRLKEPPLRMLNGDAVEAPPVSVPVPTFFTMKDMSDGEPARTLPKFSADGVTLSDGAARVQSSVMPLLRLGESRL